MMEENYKWVEGMEIQYMAGTAKPEYLNMVKKALLQKDRGK